MGVRLQAAASQALAYIKQYNAQDGGQADARAGADPLFVESKLEEEGDTERDRDDTDPIEPLTADGRFKVPTLRLAHHSRACIIRLRHVLNWRM